jgi:triacylglycerol lipase
MHLSKFARRGVRSGEIWTSQVLLEWTSISAQSMDALYAAGQYPYIFQERTSSMRSSTKAILALTLVSIVGIASAQVPSEVAEKLKAIGPVVNPSATAPLYAGRMLEREPFVAVQVQRDIAYGKDERHLLDVFKSTQPADKPLPVLIFVHGGAFVAGNRRTGPGSPFYDNVMLWAVRNGMVGVNMTYRLAPKDPWPAGPQDIGQAIRWVHDNIAQRGGDPRRIFLFGHSAGASHVAAYVAKPEFHQVEGSGLAGAMLLSGGAYRITPELVAQLPTYPGYFGTDAEQYAQRSALDGLIATSVPLWVGTAELDPAPYKAQGELLRQSLRNAGKKFTSVDFSAHSHMSEAYSIHSDDASVGNALLSFIQSQ